MNWGDFEHEIKALSEKVDYNPDILVGITRGGLVPARLLSKYLKVKDMYCLTVKKVGEERKVVTEVLDDLSDKNLLLVEDMIETGRSLAVAKQYLESKGAKVKTACLYTMPISEVNPDFYLKQVKEVEKFPWD